MKKYIYFLFFFLILNITVKIDAANINNLNLSGTSTAYLGERVLINIEAPTGGYQPDEGIWIVYTYLKYDTESLVLTEIKSPGYNTYMEYTEGGIILASEVIENSGVSGMCVNGLLHCGTYNLNLTFRVIKINEPHTTTIKVAEFGIGTLNITENREYTENDIIETIYPSEVSHNLSLKLDETKEIETQIVKLPENSQSNISPKTISEPVQTQKKSDNNYLKTLEITGYKIDFNKDTSKYSIDIDKTVDKLDIKLSAEHEKSTYQIIGNEKLENNSVIKVIVTAEDGKTREYEITIKKSDKQLTTTTEKKENDVTKVKLSDSTKKLIIGFGSVSTVIIIGGLIIFIKNFIKDRRFDKSLFKD